MDFFFVLSGTRGWSGTDVESRVTRIYLPYLPVAVALGLFCTLIPEVGNAGVPWSWWSTLTLLPNGPHSALGAAWSLSFELCFYMLAMLFLRSGRLLLCAFLWAALIVVRTRIASGLATRPVAALTLARCQALAWVRAWLMVSKADFSEAVTSGDDIAAAAVGVTLPDRNANAWITFG